MVKIRTWLLGLLIWAAVLHAEEGMYLFEQLRDLNLNNHGLKITTNELWNARDGGI